MMLAFLRSLGQFSWKVLQRFEQDRCGRVAGSLSFTTLLAVLPLTAVTIAVLSWFPVFSIWMSVIQDFVYSNFVPAAGAAVQKYLTEFAGDAGRLTVIGLSLLVVTSLMLMATIEQAFNDIWRVPDQRHYSHRFLSYVALLTLGPIFVAASLTLTSKLFALSFFASAELIRFHGVLADVLPLAFEFGAVLLLYTIVPNAPVPWRNALVGAAFAALLLEAAKHLFAAAMKYFTSYQILYGAIAALPVFLIWIYISWMIVLLGAITTATLDTPRKPGGRVRSVRRKRA